MYFSNVSTVYSKEATLKQLYATKNLKKDNLSFLGREIYNNKRLQDIYKKLDYKILVNYRIHNAINSGNLMKYLLNENVRLSNSVDFNRFKLKASAFYYSKNDNPYLLVNNNGSINFLSNKDVNKLLDNLIDAVAK